MISMAPAEVLGAIEQFRCCKNHDIEHFLRHNALEFERRGLCTTYLYADTDSYEISGYFSLTHKALAIENLSKERRKDITGSKTASIAPFILLGQLGKRMEQTENGTVIAASISGDEMLKDVFAIIALANEYIINRRVLVECDDEDRLLDFYLRNGFRLLERDDGKCTLYLKMEAPLL